MTGELPARPLADFINNRVERVGLAVTLAEFGLGSPGSSDERLLYRFRRLHGDHDRARIEDLLTGSAFHLWDIYPGLADEPAGDLTGEPRRARRRPAELTDALGRDLTRRRSVPAKLTDQQLKAAHRLHDLGGLSIRELGRRGWQAWGYSSPRSAAMALSTGFARLRLPARDRIQAATGASLAHGNATRAKRDASHPDHPDYLEHRKALRRASGEVRGVRCAATRTQYPRKGAPCGRWALADSGHCRNHDPRYAETVAADLAAARAKLGLTGDQALAA